MRKDQIIKTLQRNFHAQMEKHRMNAEIMIENPIGIHDHTAWFEGIEKELEKMAEYNDKLDMVSEYLNHYNEKGHKNQRTE
jgi:hypothetical protein|tara:strand:- start:13 stop:255 length:243 start_codon:yes stop_codon:yes gene_type:complete